MTLRRENIENIYPLTPNQEALLFHSERQGQIADPGCLTARFRITGHLTRQRLENAWNHLICAHDMLRSSIRWQNLSKAIQIVARELTLTIAWKDVRHLPRSEQQKAVDAFAEADRRRGFDLSKPPLMRLTVFCIDDDQHVAIWTFHHIVLDGWSGAVLIDQLRHLLGESERPQERFADSAPAFDRYLNWLNNRSDADEAGFWSKMLKDFTSPTRLPISDGPASTAATKPEALELSDHETQSALSKLSLIAQATESSIVFAAWGLVLGRLCNRKDVVFGATFSGRPSNMPDIETAVGLFANTVPLRVRINGAQPLGAWLSSVQNLVAEVSRFQWTSPADILESVPLIQAPLFDSVVVIENYPLEYIANNGPGSIRVSEFSCGVSSTLPLTLVVRPNFRTLIAFRDDRAISQQTALVLAGALRQTLRLLSEADPAGSVEHVFDQIQIDPIPELNSTLAQRPEVHGWTTRGPETDLEEKLLNLWRDALGHKELVVDDDFFDAGGNSLIAVRLASDIHRISGTKISPVSFAANPTVRLMARQIACGDATDRSYEPLVLLRQGDSRPPLFCLHPPGGDPIIYVDLARSFADNRTIYGVKSRAISGLRPFTNFQEMALSYAREMVRVSPAGPFHLFSECGGSSLALETAHQLEEMGLEVGAVVMLDPGWIHPERASWHDSDHKRLPLAMRVVKHGLDGKLGTKISDYFGPGSVRRRPRERGKGMRWT